MITLKNNATGEIVKCSYTRIDATGRVYYRNADNGGKQPTDKFLSERGLSLTGERAEINGVTAWYLAIGSDWSINDAKPARPAKPATPKPAKPATDGAPEPKPAPTKPTTKPATKPAPVVTETEPATPEPTPTTNGGGVDLARFIADQIAKYLPKPEPVTTTTTTTLNIVVNDTPAGNVDGYTAPQFPRILQRAAARQNIYLYGAAGCGKSHTAMQVADALKLPFYCQMQMGSKYDVIGFVDAGGVYQSTPFYHSFKSGGVCLFDEYERGDAAALITLNGALANDVITFPNGEKVTRHPDFVFIAAGNTNGLGATAEYNTAGQLDASTIDRLCFIRMDYDAELENKFSAADTTAAEFCRDLRNAIKSCGISGMIVSYRAIKAIAAQSATADKHDLLDEYILKGRDNDTAAVLYGALTDKNNPWAVALKDIALAK